MFQLFGGNNVNIAQYTWFVSFVFFLQHSISKTYTNIQKHNYGNWRPVALRRVHKELYRFSRSRRWNWYCRILMCRNDRVVLLDTYQYNDSVVNDTFQREPYCAKFRIRNTGEARLLISFCCIISCKNRCLEDRIFGQLRPHSTMPTSPWRPRQIRDKPVTSPLAQIPLLPSNFPVWGSFGEVGVMEFGLYCVRNRSTCCRRVSSTS